jgi:hypothetical protein
LDFIDCPTWGSIFLAEVLPTKKRRAQPSRALR